ncbi:hypothetical protein F4779DRAFT_566448 [Xylariaceae sp. FL0662B]|nr:hypothetical protein F4779DRAFT_566448 [Xylariaceae sp. FL0662B]
MPIFHQYPERRESPIMGSPPDQFRRDMPPLPHNSALARKSSEESIRTELCEGPISESLGPRTPERDHIDTCSDRVELIERLKRGESPTWIPNRHLESIWNQEPTSPTRCPKRATATSPNLLPSPTITRDKREPDSADNDDDDERRRQEGLNIERPLSALHSGDFTLDDDSQDGSPQIRRTHNNQQGFSTVNDRWLATSPPRDFTPFRLQTQQINTRQLEETSIGLSPLSSSISSSFAYKPPTSPLVQSESNDDVDLASPMDGIDIHSNLTMNSRRHTLMSSHSGSSWFATNPLPRRSPSLRQERSFPYQAHQPRRSLTSNPTHPTAASTPQTPVFLRSRRPSYSSDVSPLQHASMVGSYEESILRGRMSTTPSKPLDFLAQIGVLGLGECKSSLRCPPHVTLPFPAVFYSYASSSQGTSKMDDGPSPYVGQIDLENGLPNSEEDARSKRKVKSRALERMAAEDDQMRLKNRPSEPSEPDARRAERPKRRSSSPRAPPGGSYRIPKKGQIQIIIKNPNKTAVKLFLVPYDLAGMEPGTKTFIRQRSYSAGPIIDNMPDLKDNGTADRPVLRYLVHLHICCPSRGRYYLYKSIRVVFANRVPDGKEKLRNEITLPEPRFTSYKPIRMMHPPISGGSGPGANLTADKAYRRRSYGLYFGNSNPAMDAAGGFPPAHMSYQPDLFNFARDNAPVEPVPFRWPNSATRNAQQRGSSSGPANAQSPDSSQTSRPTTQDANDVFSWDQMDCQIDKYDKLSKGDVGYGGNAFAGLINGNPSVAEGLLSKRLRSLGVEGQANKESGAMEE